MKIIYFMGKSASGKDTIYRKVKEKLNPSPKEIILYTTRPIRDHEENGREYFFVADSEIAKMENEGKIIEKCGSWDIANKNIICNEGRMRIKQYLAVMANKKLREKFFGF